MTLTGKLLRKMRHGETELRALAYALKDPATPWYAKLLALAVLGYASSPIDLIPDFIPVVGYLDDLIIIPAGIWLFVRLVPPEVMERCRERARAGERRTFARWLFAGLALALWCALAIWAIYLTWPFAHRIWVWGLKNLPA
jgi:uncharacterized membrane protein YkvA (DUF1232 family)